MRYLVTGAAGFIGYHVAERLLTRGDEVTGLDDLNPYYDVRLKEARVDRLSRHPGFRLLRVGLGDRSGVEQAFRDVRPDVVIHLAAQAGVRYSLTHPHAYADANLTGFVHVAEGCRQHEVGHLVFASSSSVYGASTRMPYHERDLVAHPLSLYAATKIAGEAMAHAYSHLFAIPISALRFFTVYGPWGRPDMAYFQFARDILAGRPIRLFNEGRMIRDFTYVDDAVEAVLRIAALPAERDAGWESDAPVAGSSSAPFRLLNVGAGQPADIEHFLDILERALGRRAVREYVPMQPGDVPATWADAAALEALTGFHPATSLEKGIPQFVEWYRNYHSEEN